MYVDMAFIACGVRCLRTLTFISDIGLLRLIRHVWPLASQRLPLEEVRKEKLFFSLQVVLGEMSVKGMVTRRLKGKSVIIYSLFLKSEHTFISSLK